MEQAKYDVFISYSHKDYVDENRVVIPNSDVVKIKEAMIDAGISFWFDEECMSSGNIFTEKIVTNIEVSRVFVFLSTANANASPWTSREIACADELHKYIIPVRIDNTPYNKKVLFRIADRRYIDYYANPEKGLKELVDSIKTYLEQMQLEAKRKEEDERRTREAERKRSEEERRRREVEEKRRQEAQQQLVSDIKLLCTTLNNEEAKLELSRENLSLRAEQVIDEKRRANLRTEILNSSPIRKKMLVEIKQLHERITELEAMVEQQLSQSMEIEKLRKELTEKESDIMLLRKASAEFQQEKERNEDLLPKSKMCIHLVYNCIIFSL